jgi:hypothetical protein
MMKKILCLFICLVLCVSILGVFGSATADAAVTVIPSQYNVPRITKNPTDEWVYEFGRCQFVSRYENAILAEWHFVSPDGRDISYLQAQQEFPSLRIIMGNTKDMTLDNIPYALNGWRVYCRFSNSYGSADTGMARITVSPSGGGSYPRPTGNAMIVYYINGVTERVSSYSDGSWRTSGGVVYYMGTDGVLRSGGNPDLYTYNPGGVSPQPAWNAMTVYSVYGVPLQVYSNSDGTWRTADGTVYYMGTDGVLRSRGQQDLYPYNPIYNPSTPSYTPPYTPSSEQRDYSGEWRFAYTASGARVVVNNRGDGVWRSETGILYYEGNDGVLRARGADDLYFR